MLKIKRILGAASFLMFSMIFGFNSFANQIPDTEGYAFSVLGHAYPFLDQLIPELENDSLSIFTGDVVYHGCRDWPDFEELASTLTEYHIAAGNHDKAIHCTYNWTDDRLFYEFTKNGDQFIILDTVHYRWNIRWRQLDQLREAFKRPARNRFVFMHNAIHYLDEDIVDQNSFTDWLPNNFHLYHTWLTFTEDVRPIFESRDDVYAFFGDYGNRTKGVHYKTHNGVRYIGAGLSARTGAVDSGYSRVTVSDKGEVGIYHIPMDCDIPEAERPIIQLCKK